MGMGTRGLVLNKFLQIHYTVPIDRKLCVKMSRHGSQWILHKISIRHPGHVKK